MLNLLHFQAATSSIKCTACGYMLLEEVKDSGRKRKYTHSLYRYQNDFWPGRKVPFPPGSVRVSYSLNFDLAIVKYCSGIDKFRWKLAS